MEDKEESDSETETNTAALGGSDSASADLPIVILSDDPHYGQTESLTLSGQSSLKEAQSKLWTIVSQKYNDSPPWRFKKNYYFITLKNGEKIKRTWLVYSKSVDRVFCFCCMLFGKRDTSLSNEGYDKWKHVGDILKSHRQSKPHIRCMEAWHTLKIGMATMTTVDWQHMDLIERERILERSAMQNYQHHLPFS